MTDTPLANQPNPDISRAILNSMQARIAVVDARGAIVLVNRAWQRFAQASGDPSEATTGTGVNYLDVTRRAAEYGDGSAAKALRGIEAVLRGEQEVYELRYPCHSPTDEQWFLMRVSALDFSQPRGAVISHIDITAQHLAARARARRAQQQERARHQARELAAVQSVAERVAPTPSSAADDDLRARYAALLELAVEQRMFRVEHDLRSATRQLAERLGRQSAGPRDVIALHTRALASLRSQRTPPAKMQVYLEEARLLLIEVMGHLAAFYRDLIIAQLEQRNL